MLEVLTMSQVDDLNLDFSDRDWDQQKQQRNLIFEFRLQDNYESEESGSEKSEQDVCDLDDEYYFDHGLDFGCARYVAKPVVQDGVVETVEKSDVPDKNAGGTETTTKMESVINKALDSFSMVARRNDREEIRKKLAMGGDDDYYDDNDDDDDIGYKKPNLQSRLHSGLQICFMNESPGDTDSEGLSPRQHDIHDNLKRMAKDSLVDSDNNLQSVADLNNPNSSSTMVTKAQSLDPSQLKDKTAGSEDFQTHQEKLQEEAKLALAQAGSMAHMQLEIEKQLQKKSPMAEMVGIPGLGERRRKKLGLRKLQEMNLTSIQVLYNDLQTQIESLNEELVHLLMERDELHMEQDSMLVDIEDLTRRAEELAERTYASKDSKNIVKGKVPSR